MKNDWIFEWIMQIIFSFQLTNLEDCSVVVVQVQQKKVLVHLVQWA